MSEKDVLDMVRNYSQYITQSITAKLGVSTDFVIEDKYYKIIPFSESISKSNYRLEGDSIQIYKVAISNMNEKGFSLVSADERFPCVITYIPNGELSDTIENRAFACMLDIS
ncbi:MAG: hypothetical protein LBL90_04645 [Prevotellaceae bacterium]|nr:hypothetical protein [Prevotellaceae bacterium]